MAHRDPDQLSGSAQLTDDQFWEMREEVLAQWPTGEAVDIDDAVQFHHSLPEKKNCAWRYERAKVDDEITFMGYHSVGDFEAQLRNHRELSEECQWCAIVADSHTRNLSFEQVQHAIDTGGQLNGFPLVNYGPGRCRELVAAIEVPEHAHCNGNDTRLSTEIGLASGLSGFTLNVGDFFYYTKDAPIEEVIHNQLYDLRAMRVYQDRGVKLAIDVVPMGKTGLVSHGLCLATNVLGALLAAEYGIKHVALFTFPYGQVRADLAMLRQAIPLCERFLEQAGHDDVEVYQHVLFTPGAFPEDESRAYGGLSLYAAILGMTKGAVQRIGHRTVREGVGLPTPADFNETFRAQKTVLNTLRDQDVMIDDDRIARETEILKFEVEAIVTKTLELGDGNVAAGIIDAVKRGILDCPFPSNENVANEVMVARDVEGITRFWDPGHLPLPEEVLEYHADRLADREQSEGRPISVDMIGQDMTAFRRGEGLLAGGWLPSSE